MFVHDEESGENFFNQKTIMELTGLTQQAVSKHIKRYKAISTNTTISCISLEVFNSNRPVDFHSFNALTYVAYRSNKPRAILYRDYVEKALNDKFNRDVGFNQSVLSLEEEAKETIKMLECKVWEHTKKAFESTTKEEFQYYMDLADKYSMDSMKRRFQLRNELNCSKRLRRELKMNQKGLLTESGENKVFIPDNQSTLIEFNILLK